MESDYQLFFYQAEDGIRDDLVTGVQTCALPIVLHGDAAFAGQGVWAETLNFADIGAYSVGGTIQVIVNNLLGFTTEPREYQSSRFASSLAKRQAVPIFHVNGEDPDAVVRVETSKLELFLKAAEKIGMRWLWGGISGPIIARRWATSSCWTGPATAATATAKWMTAPSRGRSCTRKSRITRSFGRFTRKKS